MKITMKKFTALFLSLLFAMSLMACSEGPAEEAGENIDEIAQDAENAVEDACEDVKEAANAEDKDC